MEEIVIFHKSWEQKISKSKPVKNKIVTSFYFMWYTSSWLMTDISYW